MNSLFEKYTSPEELTHEQHLRQIEEEGVRQVYGIGDLNHPKDDREKVIATRYFHEAETIEKAGLVRCFLGLWVMTHIANGLLMPTGQGIAASMIAYALGITGIDPLRYGLIFERFLNPEKLSQPHINISLGGQHIFDVIRFLVHEYDFGQDKFSVPVDSEYDKWLQGWVSSEERAVSVIRTMCHRIMRTTDSWRDSKSIPLDDLKTFEMLARGDTEGVFQLESDGMRGLLRDLQPNTIEELFALIALYCPGPIKMIPDFIKRKHGRQKITYLHPLLEPIMKETCGIMVYQEQVQQAAVNLAGFSLGQGDLFRRALGKKKPQDVQIWRRAFCDGCVKREVCSSEEAEHIFSVLAKEGCCVLNKSHAVACGILSFQTTYLKANYPSEFMEVMRSSGTDGDN